MHYTVRDGDTLWLIAQKFGLDYRSIALANSIADPDTVVPGQVLHIPRRTRLIGIVPDYAAHEGLPEALSSPEAFSEIVYTFLRVRPDGSLLRGTVDPSVQTLRAYRTRVLAGVSNQSESVYSTGSLDHCLLDQNRRTVLASEVVDAVATNALDGVVLDFQALAPRHADAYTCLVREVATRLRRMSPYYTVAVYLPFGSLDGGFDVPSLGDCADLVMVEGFEKGSLHFEGPSTPLGWLRDTVARMMDILDRSKIVVALGAYGLDWGPRGPAVFLSCNEAEYLARGTGARVVRDAESGCQWFQYSDRSGQTHTVWFEDSSSLAAKIVLLEEFGIRKIAIWRLGTGPSDLLAVSARAGTWC
ncbi:MAG: LysM peptidoglycan-binding domain-containing protein [Firmicutes bacterium]|nr:LysM peptidoglycan-binding domain-containing protein [Bacillota bacterium]